MTDRRWSKLEIGDSVGTVNLTGSLQVAQSDFRKLLLEAQTQESAAAADFKKMKSESKARLPVLRRRCLMRPVASERCKTQAFRGKQRPRCA